MKYFFFLLFIGIFSMNLSAQSDKDEFYYKNGIQLLDSNNFQAAIYYLNKAIEINPFISLYYHNRGYAKQMVRDLNGALSDYKEASKIIPSESLYYYLIGNIYNEQQNYSEAITFYTNAIKIDETDYLYTFNRGNMYLKLEDYQNAIIDYDLTIKNNARHHGTYNNRGIAKYKLNDLQGACNDWKQAYNLGLDISKTYLDKYCSNISIDSIPEVINIFENDNNQKNGNNPLPTFNYNGLTNFNQFVRQNIRYPISSLENGETGKVIISFYIMKDGSIDSVKIINSITKSLDTEAIRLIGISQGFWKPAIFMGKPIEAPVIVPIEFQTHMGNKNDLTNIKKQPSNRLILNTFESDIEKEDFNFNQEIIYFDSIWHITIPEKAKYYRVTYWDIYSKYYHGKYTDYTIDSIRIGEGKYFNKMKEDTLLIYYPSGQIKCKGLFARNMPINAWYYFYENGKLQQKVVFTANSFYVETFFNESDSLIIANGTGKWQMRTLDGEYKYEVLYTGEFKNGKKNGTWALYHNNIKIVEEIYKNGGFTKGKMLDTETNQIIKLNQEVLTEWIFYPVNLNISEQLKFDSTTTNANYKFKIQ